MKPFRAKCYPRAVLVVLAVIVSLVLSGCKGSSNANSNPAISQPEVRPVTIFNQTIAVADGGSSPFPGQANYWDIGSDFSLVDGSADQFDGALTLMVGTTPFPFDQDYDELSYYIPLIRTVNGLVVAAVTDGNNTAAALISGSYSAALGSVSDAKLSQTLNLTAATGTVTLSWNDIIATSSGNMANEPDPTYRVVVRDTAGNLLQTLFSTTASSVVPASHTVDLTAYAGRSVILSFERFGSVYGNSISIDDVSVVDGAAVSFVLNGDFETGDFTDWTTNTPVEIQNITSGARILEGLSVKRSFFTVPDQKWGRWVDVFENNTGSDISKTVTYSTDLGSDDTGIIYYSPNTSSMALTAWDGSGSGTGSGSDRDVGIVFAGASGFIVPTTVTFTSDDGLGNGNGSDIIEETFNITVPAGGRVAVVHFIIMNGTATGNTATGIGDLATDIDTEVKQIVDNFWDTFNFPLYTEGMTPEQINAIINF